MTTAAIDKLHAANRVYRKHFDRIEREADTLNGAASLMRRTGQPSVRDAIMVEAKRAMLADLPATLESLRGIIAE